MAFVQGSMLATGLGTILQGFPRGPIGSGYLCPSLAGPAFVPASLVAAQTGGLSLVCGMTVLAGLVQVLFSATLRRLRALLPPEVTGVIVLMVGLSLVRLGVTNLIGVFHPDEVAELHEAMVGVLTLGVMVGVTVAGGRALRLYGVLLGIIVGYGAAYAVGGLGPAEIRPVLDAPLLALPRPAIFTGPVLDVTLLVPFLVAALSSTAKTVGDLTTCQRINDAHWDGPEMHAIQRGTMADALSVVSAGLVGGLGQSTSSSNVGLAVATGITSRRIAFWAGGLFAALGLVPMLAMTVVVMPKPVRGATLVFVACFMIVAGIQLVVTRPFNPRRTFVVGGAIIAGLTVDVLPFVLQGLPRTIRMLASSDIAAATIVAIGLNLLLREKPPIG
ncbi:MAG TPA: solute carrier family 23 protein, partial [Methylomirabilota bacterium]|jgi:NCS2 family nucleobase:cation symporter-2|nr:solute carrier family 23 protein [Methylomirabilota bacterium]